MKTKCSPWQMRSSLSVLSLREERKGRRGVIKRKSTSWDREMAIPGRRRLVAPNLCCCVRSTLLGRDETSQLCGQDSKNVSSLISSFWPKLRSFMKKKKKKQTTSRPQYCLFLFLGNRRTRKNVHVEMERSGQWLWLSWQSGRFQHQRSAVHFLSVAKF